MSDRLDRLEKLERRRNDLHTDASYVRVWAFVTDHAIASWAPCEEEARGLQREALEMLWESLP